MAHGHFEARYYPLGMLTSESNLIVRRENNGHVTTVTLLQQAVSGVLSKKANKAFEKTIRKLLED